MSSSELFNSCYKCPNRSVSPDCHTNCKQYANAKAEKERINAVIRREHITEDNYILARKTGKGRRSNGL